MREYLDERKLEEVAEKSINELMAKYRACSKIYPKGTFPPQTAEQLAVTRKALKEEEDSILPDFSDLQADLKLLKYEIGFTRTSTGSYNQVFKKCAEGGIEYANPELYEKFSKERTDKYLSRNDVIKVEKEPKTMEICNKMYPKGVFPPQTEEEIAERRKVLLAKYGDSPSKNEISAVDHWMIKYKIGFTRTSAGRTGRDPNQCYGGDIEYMDNELFMKIVIQIKNSSI
ncbi:hypothetical protein H4J45_17650 [Colwellia sp. BRX10-6]|uniref:hypothetical protein n=1 Tax=unclassified Colwellia TaxID=196834 RepID=UPI0015F35B0B|nr:MULTISPECIES: hypothetical protein [unclassified Colwellia]MBA6383828.1 hypothetical protein [Colwellia sp. BRX10-9]MBA6395909.1 hypothetical protein [Colwellia sp. BRX10-6]